MVNILIGCTGSVATIKLPILVQTLLSCNIDIQVKVVVTKYARHFFKKEEITNDVEIYTDEDEWQAWQHREDPIIHIELVKWADAFVIAPLDANTLGKLSNGLCDNLLTCVVRAWDMDKPLIFCPAMNTKMYDHPVTKGQIDKLVSWGYKEIPVISKKLACGDTGLGAMAEVETIVQFLRENVFPN